MYKCMEAHGKTSKEKLNIRFYPVSNNKPLEVFEQEQLSHTCVLARFPLFSGSEV